MSITFDLIKRLVADGNIRVSMHAFRRLGNHLIASDDVVAWIGAGEVIEDYPAFHIGPAVLVLQFDQAGAPIHAVWGLEKGTSEPAVLVTVYRPDRSRWSADFRTRTP